MGYRKRAGCLCFRTETEEEVLLVSSNNHPGNWIVPAGGVEPGEVPEEAAIREVTEEAGVLGKIVRFVGVFPNEVRKTRTYIYVLIVTEEQESWPEARNIGRKRQWFSTEKALSILTYKPLQHMYIKQAIETR